MIAPRILTMIPVRENSEVVIIYPDMEVSWNGGIPKSPILVRIFPL